MPGSVSSVLVVVVVLVMKGSGQLELGGFCRFPKSQGQTENMQRVRKLVWWPLPSKFTFATS